MCLIAIGFQLVEDCPLVVAANREEYFDRPATRPAIQTAEIDRGLTRQYVCGLDQRASGTWLGVNDAGLLIAVTNRYHEPVPPDPRSRGLLCSELLLLSDAQQAADRAAEEFRSGRYAGANFACLDRNSGVIVHGGEEIRREALTPGLHLITNGDLNDDKDDRQRFFRALYAEDQAQTAAEFIANTSKICAQGPDEANERTIVVRVVDRGTVSSSLVAVPEDPTRAVYQHAPGPPDRTPYEDYSSLLRDILRSS